jgi:hypothetical protein
VGGEVVGDDVDHDAEAVAAAHLRQPGEALLAAELVAQARRVDGVVAVGRPRHRLRDRRQVEVADAEGGEVGDGLGGRREVGLRRELPPVGGDELRH